MPAGFPAGGRSDGVLVDGGESGFVQSANRAYPVVRQVVERCVGCDSVFGITNSGVVNITACAFVLHRKNPP